ncbi:methionine ABC transporter ATP-binding protein [Desulfovibrio sp. OttesenSCG-928-M14]|nr:methionine ABC transporter ATP-binding protein [Desulfovibrio sp. OttesenSCG-928-M14]
MIEVAGLEKRYGETVVLKDITFSIEKGEVFGVVGHSGAGKSTLLRCFNALEDYQSGSVKVMGREVGDLNRRERKELRRDMGMIFQTFNLMESKNVFENVAFPLEVWKMPKQRRWQRVMELLALVGLADKSQSRVQSLSGGQKQRVGIARALALSPRILLCDEATSALDPKTTGAILDLLENIRKELDLTIVLVTHQMEVVKRACNRVLLLDGGITQGIGRTDSLFLAPTPDLKKLIEDEYTLIPSGTNIRMWFPRDISQNAVITAMARALDIDFSIVGGKLERYIDDVRGFLIINVDDRDLEKVLNYLQEKQLYWEVMEDGL